MAELDRAAAEVEAFDAYVRALESVHSVEVPEVDWTDVAQAEEPEPPARSDRHERLARSALENYKPKVLESKKRQAARRETLEQHVSEAVERDGAEYHEALTRHATEVEEWQASKELARRVRAGEPEALVEASQQVSAMADGDSLRYVDVEFAADGPTRATVGIASIEQVVPSEQKALLASGKLSVKQMPKGRYNELYQDFVCGSALLVGNAILGMLPVPELIVTVKTEMLNTATGHIEDTPILSMFVPRSTIARLNLERIDASDAMSNFSHNMNFLKTKGFRPTEPISAPTSNE